MTARILRPIFSVRRSVLGLGIAAAALAFPAGSMGATKPPCAAHVFGGPSCQIKTTPIHVGSQGFELTLLFKQGPPTGYGGRQANSVAGILFKHSGKGTENDNYAFSGGGDHPLKFKIGKKPLQFAQITGTFANGGGSINLIFRATGPARHVNVPKGCSGVGGQRRPGTFNGSYTLHAGKLGTITHKSFKATISTASYTCSPPSHGYDLYTPFADPYVDVFKSTTGSVTETIVKSSNGSGWAFTHTYYVTKLPSSDYSIGSGLKSATVKGGGGITGTATYSDGMMSGTTFGVTMASIGRVTPFRKPQHATQTHS